MRGNEGINNAKYGANVTGKPPGDELTGAKMGPSPTLNPQQYDHVPGGPQETAIRDQANKEARLLLQDNKVAILSSQVVSLGIRQALGAANQQSIDPNLIHANATARPIEYESRIVVTPSNPNAAMLAIAALLAQANFAPGAYPAPPITQAINPQFETYQTAILQGRGNALRIPLRAGEIGIIDKLGITTFAEQADFELVWMMAHGIVQATATDPPSGGSPMIPQRRGWPFGTADNPADLSGLERIAPQTGPLRQSSNATTGLGTGIDDDTGGGTIVLNVQHTGLASGIYAPQPYYVRIIARGWAVRIDPRSDQVVTKTIASRLINPSASQ